MNIEDLEGTGLSKDRTYVGIVVDNNDPRKLDRIQVKVPELFEGIEDAHLPWAIPTNNKDATSKSGVCDIPPVGAKVRLKFQKGSIDHPEYFDYLVDEGCILEEKLENYPFKKVRKFNNGTYIVLDTQTNEIYLYHKGGNVVLDIVDANVELTVKNGSLKVEVENSISYKCKDFSVESDTIVMTATTAKLAADTTIDGNTKTIGSLTNNGKDVGSSHKHSGVRSGISPTGGPV
jgi:Type VI secretion system/phage-baseplate injector OB domain